MTDVEIPVTTVWDIAAQALDDAGFWILSLLALALAVLVVRRSVRRRRR